MNRNGPHISVQQQSEKSEVTQEESANLIIGCDGAFSAVRRLMLQTPGFDYSQTYIDHGYIELCIPPVNGEVNKLLNYMLLLIFHVLFLRYTVSQC